MLSHANLIVNALNTLILSRLDAPPVQLHAGPLCHLAAGGRVFTNTLACGRHVMLARFRPAELLALVARERVTGMSVVPTMIGMLLAEPALGTTDLSSLRMINYGGAPMPEAILTRFMARLPHVSFGQAYGMTELSPVATHLTPEDHRAGGPRLRSAGRAVTALEIAVADDEGRMLPPGVAGEVVARGPTVMQGYWRQPELTRHTLRGGWLHTGDVATIDADGYVKIVDRIKDVVKTGGEWVSSLDVEDIILRVPGVAEVAVVGMPDDRWGERPVALVVVKPQTGAPTEDAIRRHVADVAARGTISKYAVPDRVYFVDAIPKTSVGKLDKKVIRAKLAEQNRAAAAASAS